MKKCCFTGHRPQSLPFRFDEQDERCVRLKSLLRKEIERQITESGVTAFISGMAIGVDMYAAEIVLELKAVYPELTLEAAVPCASQADKWSAAMQKRYRDILRRCDKTTLIQRDYDNDCMHKRNRYMVDSSDTVIAVWNGRPSGTGKTVRYAVNQGKTVTVIDPVTFSITIEK